MRDGINTGLVVDMGMKGKGVGLVLCAIAHIPGHDVGGVESLGK